MPKVSKKRTFIRDTFEKIETDRMAKQVAKDVASVFRPTWEGRPKHTKVEGKTAEVKAGPKHTPLNLDELQKKYKEQDAKKEVQLKQRLFHLVKEGEKKSLEREKREKQERAQQLTQEEEQKTKEEEERRRREAETVIPKGKKRRSIFSPREKAREKHAEYKPATGKQ